jgi:hypothetical protein
MNPLQPEIAYYVLQGIKLAEKRSSNLRTLALDPNISVSLAAYYNGKADEYNENITRLSATLGS